MADQDNSEMGMDLLRTLYGSGKSTGIELNAGKIIEPIPLNPEAEHAPLSFIKKVATKVIQTEESTDFVNNGLLTDEISLDPNIRDKTDYWQKMGSIEPIPLYQVDNKGGKINSFSALAMAEGIYKTLTSNENPRLNRPYSHLAKSQINPADFMTKLNDGSPVLSAASNGFNEFLIQDTVNPEILSKFLQKIVPQHTFRFKSFTSGDFFKHMGLTHQANRYLAENENSQLDPNIGHQIWDKDLSPQMATLAANIASRGLIEAKSGKPNTNGWTLLPEVNTDNKGIRPYYGLLLAQLGYHLISPVSEKLIAPERRHLLFPKVSTTPGYKFGLEFVSPAERSKLSSYLAQGVEITSEPIDDFANSLSKKMLELNQDHSWQQAYPKLRDFIQRAI